MTKFDCCCWRCLFSFFFVVCSNFLVGRPFNQPHFMALRTSIYKSHIWCGINGWNIITAMHRISATECLFVLLLLLLCACVYVFFSTIGQKSKKQNARIRYVYLLCICSYGFLCVDILYFIVRFFFFNPIKCDEFSPQWMGYKMITRHHWKKNEKKITRHFFCVLQDISFFLSLQFFSSGLMNFTLFK